MIKKFLTCIICLLIVISMSACTVSEESDKSPEESEESLGDSEKASDESVSVESDQSLQESEESLGDSEKASDESVSVESDQSLQESEESLDESEKSSVLSTPVFETENITRITFYAYNGTGKGSEVLSEHMTEITNWLDTFTVGEEAPEVLPPGTNTYYVEIEYSDGTVIKHGLDVISVDGTEYCLKSGMEPDCFMEIISKTSFK